MISSKYITKIAVVLTAFVVVLCVLAMIFSEKIALITKPLGYGMEYETKLFNTSEIININIAMDENEWRQMLDNATKEEYYQCDVTINGTTFYKVGIRPKGNTSLSSVARDPDNDRYSFKLEFGQFVDGQTCFGLDKLVLNNNYADVTNMKEAVIYDMYQYLDADASLYNYAKISLNGEYWATYLALEAVEESFMLRNFGTEKGYLYKPDGMNMGNRDKNNTDKTEKQNFMKRGGPGGGGSGANLNYIDDDLDSYSAIWDGAVNDNSKNDRKRIVTALKNISQGTMLESYLDVENTLKYMAVHSFAVNDDSLSGNMAHNYYLYESGGQLNILPWDYNLSFGGMRGGNASDVINDPIDTPFSATNFFDALLENEEYKEKYHEYYNKLIEEYIYGGKFEETYNRIRNQIDGLVETDPNAMYTYEKYTEGAKMLYDTVMLRAESVRGQLAGNIPSTNEEQRANQTSLIDSSSINISLMGDFMGGGAGPQRDQMENGMRPQRIQNNMQPQNRTTAENGEITQQQQAPLIKNEVPAQGTENSGSEAIEPQTPNDEFGGRVPPEGFPEHMMEGMQNPNAMSEESKPMSIGEFFKEYLTPIISVILLGLTFLFVIFYKRKTY